MDGATVCISVGTFILFVIVIGINVVWVYVGTEYKHEPCQLGVKPLSLSNWLIIHGWVHITVYSVSALLAVLGSIFEAAAFLVLPMLLIILNALFDLAWFVVGIVILVNAGYCHTVADHLWNTLLAAVIFAGLGVISTHQANDKNKNWNSDFFDQPTSSLLYFMHPVNPITK